MTRSPLAVALIAGMALLALATAAPAQTSDAQFVERAAHDNAVEVELGQLARERAADPAVREYGDRLVLDHRAASVELKALAARKGWQVPEHSDAQHTAMRDRLKGLSGPEFDRKFAEEMVKDHQKSVSDFERAAQTINDPELRDWAEKTLPVLREHQRMAQDLSQRLGAAPAPPVAASPPTVVTTTAAAAPPWCAGAWNAKAGTNFGTCPK